MSSWLYPCRLRCSRMRSPRALKNLAWSATQQFVVLHEQKHHEQISWPRRTNAVKIHYNFRETTHERKWTPADSQLCAVDSQNGDRPSSERAPWNIRPTPILSRVEYVRCGVCGDGRWCRGRNTWKA